MAHTFTNLLTYIIFSTKDRLPYIDADLKAQLYPYMGGIIRELDGKASIINGTSDHVHPAGSIASGFGSVRCNANIEDQFVEVGP